MGVAVAVGVGVVGVGVVGVRIAAQKHVGQGSATQIANAPVGHAGGVTVGHGVCAFAEVVKIAASPAARSNSLPRVAICGLVIGESLFLPAAAHGG